MGWHFHSCSVHSASCFHFSYNCFNEYVHILTKNIFLISHIINISPLNMSDFLL